MSHQPYSLDALLKEQIKTKGKLANFEARQPPLTTNPHAFAHYYAADGLLQERAEQLRAKEPRDRNLFDDLDFLMGDGHGV